MDSPALYRGLADLLVLVHLSYVAFVVLGAGLVFRWPWLAWVHLPAVSWAAVVELAGWICPLTPLEVAWRVRAGEAGYAGGFVETYLLPALYPPELTREVQVGLGLLVLGLNAGLYGLILRRRGRAGRRSVA